MAKHRFFKSQLVKQSPGMSLLELLVVIAIIVILASLIGYFAIPRFIHRANDAKRKAHLEEYRIQFEAYFADRGHYPPQYIMADSSWCNKPQPDMAAYMPRLLCDPQSMEPYVYKVSDDLQNYWLYANLRDDADADITRIGCQQGCGPDLDDDGQRDFNYGISNQPLEGQIIETPDGETIEVPGGDDSGYGEFPSTAPPICGEGCSPNTCGVCCPGLMYRCSGDGNSCLFDATCGTGY